MQSQMQEQCLKDNAHNRKIYKNQLTMFTHAHTQAEKRLFYGLFASLVLKVHIIVNTITQNEPDFHRADQEDSQLHT